MTLLAVPLHIAALVLVLSGADKLGDPTPATVAMREAKLFRSHRFGTWPGRVLGVVEVVVGGSVLAFGGTVTAVAMAATYLGFGAFLVLLQRRAAGVGCGCFGASTAPPGPVHLVIDVTAAAVAIAAAATTAPDLVAVADEGILELVTELVLVATGAALVIASSSLLEDVKNQRKALRTP